MKDFGDLLEHALYTPAGEVEGQEIRGGEQRGVEQIGNENNRLLRADTSVTRGGRSAGAWPAHSRTTPSLVPKTRPAASCPRCTGGAASAEKGVLG